SVECSILAIELCTVRSRISSPFFRAGYTESQNQPATDPLIWWSNGGPGCSGLMGLLTEHGPFRPLSDGSGNLTTNPHSWNLLANMLYVEAPIGVGFSFSNNASDYTVGDDRTASDNLIGIGVFLQKFPHLMNNTLYISSESYGGHYAPQLATLLVNDSVNFPMFKGMLLGNPFTDLIENLVYGMAGTICGHSLADVPTCTEFIMHCQTNFSLLACPLPLVRVLIQAGALDRYGLDYPTCPASGRERRSQSEARRRLRGVFGSSPLPDEIAEAEDLTDRQRHLSQFVRGLRLALAHASPRHARAFRRAEFSKTSSSTPTPYDPCLEAEETVYLNRADVRAALNVNPTVGAWVSCSIATGKLHYNFLDEFRFLESLYPPLIAANLTLVIQSGDDDSICATLGTQEWMYKTFSVKPNGGWRQWYYESSEYGVQIGGSRVDFEGITLVTVHGSGHMVPNYTPEKGLAVFTNFLNGTFSRL
ncbi:MAG: hypothetical protein Q7T57_05045, partial [Dehalococcoidales bacterium]|nr:hypothetical protein [Dehalococcoidales bacterium]